MKGFRILLTALYLVCDCCASNNRPLENTLGSTEDIFTSDIPTSTTAEIISAPTRMDENKKSSFHEYSDPIHQNYSDITDIAGVRYIRAVDIVVNKCCQDGEFFSLDKQDCDTVDNGPNFAQYVNMVLRPDSAANIHTKFASLKVCPGTEEKPTTSIANYYSHDLDAFGNIVDFYNNVKYDHSHYCLELIAQNSVELSSTQLALAHCAPDLVRKCCPAEQHFNESQHCVNNTRDLSFSRGSDLRAGDTEDLIYNTTPECENDDYFMYHLGRIANDTFVMMKKDQSTKLIAVDTIGCKEGEYTLRNKDYCIEHRETGDDVEKIAIMCTKKDGDKIFKEKFTVVAILMGISCIALSLTAIHLLFEKIRRGPMTVKKISTLAGKLQLGYVMTNLVAFLLLIIGMTAKLERNFFCSFLAGLTVYFLLAAFHWNTSICIECLLISMHVRSSDDKRFKYHTMWALGVPKINTGIVVLIDLFQENLPCSIVRPKIGVPRCFISDETAKLLYLYLPMFITLCANVVLLLTSKYKRAADLKKLEKGDLGKETSCNANDETSGNVRRQQSGLRTHQDVSTWNEAFLLVSWSGITWMAEIAAALQNRFQGTSDAWYNNFWYIPIAINSLRGIGIFYIIVMTTKARQQLLQLVRNCLQRTGLVKPPSTTGQSHQEGKTSTTGMFPLRYKRRSDSLDLTGDSHETSITQISFTDNPSHKERSRVERDTHM